MTSKRRKVVVILLGVALIAALAAYFTREREPSYQGKPLSEWITAYQKAKTPKEAEPAKAAVRAMGTNALPFLVSCIAYRPSNAQLTYESLRGKVLEQVNPSWGRAYPWNARRHSAFVAFSILGRDATPALPALNVILKDAGHDTEYPAQYAKACIFVITNLKTIDVSKYYPPGHTRNSPPPQ